MKVTLIICTFNRCSLLYKTLDSISNLNLKNIKYELIVIDNNSNDNTRKVCDEFSYKIEFLNYFLEKKQGLSYARNRGIDESSGDIITFIDDDVLLSKDFIINIIDSFVRFPDALIIGGKVVLEYLSTRPIWLIDLLEPSLSCVDYGDKVMSVDIKDKFLVGANISFKSKILKKNKFNTQLGRVGDNLLSGEETELCLRILASNTGKAYYVPNIELKHLVSKERLQKSWFKKRFYDGGLTFSVEEQNNFKAVKNILFRMLKFLILFFLNIFSNKRFYFYLCFINTIANINSFFKK